MFATAVAGSLPKPAWLAETGKLWPKWQAEGAALDQAKLDATLLWIKAQEDAGLSVIGDGEQSRQHFVHGFLEKVAGIDFEYQVEMGIRNDCHKAMVPQVVAPLSLTGRVDGAEARFLRGHSVADTIGRALQFVPRQHLIACTHCDLAPMPRAVAEAKLAALAAGARLADQRLAAAGG